MSTARLLTIPLLAAALCAALPAEGAAQGGWRQWDIHLRDGRRLEANPLGAPDDGQLSLSVAGFVEREDQVARARVRVVAAQPAPGDSLPPLPVGAACTDAIVRRDGTRTVGRITLAHVRWSEGVVVQRGDSVDLRDVAYLVFAAPRGSRRGCGRART